MLTTLTSLAVPTSLAILTFWPIWSFWPFWRFWPTAQYVHSDHVDLSDTCCRVDKFGDSDLFWTLSQLCEVPLLWPFGPCWAFRSVWSCGLLWSFVLSFCSCSYFYNISHNVDRSDQSDRSAHHDFADNVYHYDCSCKISILSCLTIMLIMRSMIIMMCCVHCLMLGSRPYWAFWPSCYYDHVLSCLFLSVGLLTIKQYSSFWSVCPFRTVWPALQFSAVT